MTRSPFRRRAVTSLAALGVALVAVVPAIATPAHAAIPDGTRFYTPRPNPGAVKQINKLNRTGQPGLANKIRKMVQTPHAAWKTSGTPEEVTKSVRSDVRRAAQTRTMPVLVAYFLPFRDCGAYSAGGATSVAQYKAWIDGFAAGIGKHKAAVMLEPDGLGIIPHYTDINGNPEWCRPAEADPATAAVERFEMLNYAVDTFKALGNTHVYLDGTHNGWLSTGDAANRLVRAGVLRADGFFLNVSNFEPTPKLLKFGNWVSKCIYYGTHGGNFQQCASQYYPADPNDFSTWGLSDAWYDANVGAVSPDDLPHFVADTSRNGQGTWTPPADNGWPDPMIWCNPPDRGLGVRPTTRTGDPLADAFLWIKIPGESDGQCDRGTGTGLDPARGNTADPAAGSWFEQQAIELVRFANPPLR